MISDAHIFNEVSAIRSLFNLKAIPIAAGGIKDSRGAITLFVEGDEKSILKCLEYIKIIKGEPETNGRKRNCAKCSRRCDK